MQGFINSANSNGGYYIGRYEASDGMATEDRTSSTSDTNRMEVRKNRFVYNFVTQLQAAELCRNMYTNEEYTTDLVNGYAWDTAIVFIQNFGQSNYSKQISFTSGTVSMTGNTGGDEQLHINDMASNVIEWTTETSNDLGYPCSNRGGGYSSTTTDSRQSERTIENESYYGFRPILYI